MPIIDSQVHAYEANTPKRPWHDVPNWPAHVTGDEMVAAMDKVGVDGAIFISAFSMYQYDASYAVEVQRAHPGRFALVKPVDPDDPAVLGVGIARDVPDIRAEFTAAGVPFEKRVGRMMEGIGLCKALWSGKPVDWDGRWQLKQDRKSTRLNSSHRT